MFLRDFRTGKGGLKFTAMKKLILLIAAVAMSYANATAQGCLPEGITFTTQAQIDNFQTNYPGCTVIEGNVTIQGSNITNLNGLSVLTNIGDYLSIYGNDSLTSLEGLENLTYLGSGLLIKGNTALTNLTGMGSLTSISGNLWIYDNNALTSLVGLENLASVGGSLEIGVYFDPMLTRITDPDTLTPTAGNLLTGEKYYFIGNPSLISLTGLDNLNFIGGDFNILYNNSLSNLNGLSNLYNIAGNLWIEANNALTNLTGLENLNSIEGDFIIRSINALTSLAGLENLTFIGGYLSIQLNPSLSLCDSEWLCNYLTAPTGAVMISDNAPGCNSIIELAGACGGLPCLPYGSYYFRSQSDIDNFQLVFPNCSGLYGSVGISGNDITSLSGLDIVTSIGGGLGIGSSNSLTSLTGLDNLTSIGGGLDIGSNISLTSLAGLDNLTFIGGYMRIDDNYALTNLTGLDNLTSIGGYVYIGHNSFLTNLTGLENLTSIGGNLGVWFNSKLTSLTGMNNIDANSITNLEIRYNTSLSTCEVQSICNYLAAPNGTVGIYNNAPGCDSPSQVLAACEAVTVEEIEFISGSIDLLICPNPFTRHTTLEFTLQHSGLVHLAIYNQLGEQVAVLVDKYKPAGEHKVSWNVAGLPAGIYYGVLRTINQTASAKLIILEF